MQPNAIITASEQPLARAVARAQERAWSAQGADGTWECRGDTGPLITAHVLVILHYIGALEPEMARGVSAHLAAQQLADGSFPIYPGADEGDFGTTGCVWAALSVAGSEREAQERARAHVRAHGGAERLVAGLAEGDLGALFAAMAGLVDPLRLPDWPVAWMAIPRVKRWLERRVNMYFLNLPFEAYLITRDLKRRARGASLALSGRDRRVLAACLETYANFQNPDGSFNEMALQTATMLATLHAAGVPLGDDRMQRALGWLRTQAWPDAHGLNFSTFSSVTWATAYQAHALLASGVPASDARIERALAWLVAAQCREDQAAQLNPEPGALRQGGWAFQRVNVRLPDMDDTAVVLALFGEAKRQRLSAPLAAEVERSHALGIRWLVGMQNPDGGWAAYTRGHASKAPGPGLTEPLRFPPPLSRLRTFARDLPLALGDPSTEGLSGRVVRALGLAGFHAARPEVRRALVFFQHQQCDFGPWWGRWLVNYLPTTAHVLLGLAAVGADLRAPWVTRAIRWVKDKQRRDGGWGEEPESYADPSRAGDARESMPALTGLVVSALSAVGEGSSPETARAVRYLLDMQEADGSWPDHDWLAPSLPPRMFYRYPVTTRFYPLTALGRLLARPRVA
jgi:squalene-hopene/tetraprenyl-beta-curcumene cyclase